MTRGKLIVIEGSDCTGKDSVIELLKLPDNSIISREPGGTKIAEDIRNILLNTDHSEMDDLTTFLLFSASRRDHIINKIAPAILNGTHVLLNRYYHSSLIYQHQFNPKNNIVPSNIAAMVTKNIITTDEYYAAPDLVIVFYSSDYSIIKKRLDLKNKDRIEMNDDQFFKNVNRMYSVIHDKFINLLIENNNTKYVTIDISKYQDNLIGLVSIVQEAIDKCING